MDFFNRAMEQAKQLQQIATEAMQKSAEQAQPYVADAVAKAQELQKTLIEQTPQVTAAAQVQYNAALQHAGTMIQTGKTVLEAGTAQAQQHLSIFAEQAPESGRRRAQRRPRRQPSRSPEDPARGRRRSTDTCVRAPMRTRGPLAAYILSSILPVWR